MQHRDCDNCGKKNFPMNESIRIDGRVYCSSCLTSNFPDQQSLNNRSIVKEFDPTVCSSCSKDFGSVELKKLSNYPICNDCEITIKNRTFPVWVKGFLVGIAAIVVAAFVWNWKFYQAYRNINHANEYFTKADYANAYTLMSEASETVPEVSDLKTLASYFHGVELLMKEDKGAEALAEFEKCKNELPPDYDIKTLMLHAKIGATFDAKDYQGFLEASKEYLAQDTTQAVSFASVASAYSCIYADKGYEDAKVGAFLYLDKAKAIDDTSSEMKQYYNMIEYRMDAKKIITKEDFKKQFPNGWTKN